MPTTASRPESRPTVAACSERLRRWAAGTPDFRFYELRHAGSTLAANAGASLADPMAHMGHASVRAAMIYQHATAEQQRKISSGISAAGVEIRSRQGCSDGDTPPASWMTTGFVARG